MKIITRVEIRRFRSIDAESIATSEINIFSGVNNSGKSNILRALNLFFNGETVVGRPFDFYTDYNRALTGQAGGKRAVSVCVHFSGMGNAALKNPFSIIRTFELNQETKTEYRSSDPEIDRMLKEFDGNVVRQFTTFINKVQFMYVPAVRDRSFVKHMFLRFEEIIELEGGDEFSRKVSDLSEILSEKSRKISNDFEQFIGMPTRAALSARHTDILGEIDIRVNSGITIKKGSKKKGSLVKDVVEEISLFSSGDGVLMSYLAYFIAYLSRETRNRYFVWGFEEPENSLEYSKTQRLAEDFYEEFRKNAQIFLTTHSPAFVNLRNRDGVAFYRVYIDAHSNKKLTRIRTLDQIQVRQLVLFKAGDLESSEYEHLQKELHLVEYAVEIEAAVSDIVQKERILESSRNSLKQRLSVLDKVTPQKIFICEDEKCVGLWVILLKYIGLSDVEVISSNGCTNNDIEKWVTMSCKRQNGYHPLVFRQLDRDGFLDEQVSAIESSVAGRRTTFFEYEYKMLPVNEIENFVVLSESKRFDDKFWSEHENALRDLFDNTSMERIKQVNSFLSNATDDAKLFKPDLITIQRMRSGALVDKNKLFPGKDICARIPNFKPHSILKLHVANRKLHPELEMYLKMVKSFFDGLATP